MANRGQSAGFAEAGFIREIELLREQVPDLQAYPFSVPALHKLRKLKLHPALSFGTGKPGRVLAQQPRAGVAAAPGMKISITIGAAG